MRPALLAALVLAALSGCAAGPPAPVPTGSAAVVDHTEQADVAGEWVLTRTVESSDEIANPAREVGAVSTRWIRFEDVSCADGPCTGEVLSGPTQAVRDSTLFSSAGNVIRYEFTGFINCLRQDSSAVLVPNGYAFTSTVELRVIATAADDESTASTLEGTLTYSDTVTNEALEAGCSREPVSATTVYTLSAVRGVAAPAPTATPAP